MTPPCHTFAASELPLKVQLDVHGRRRKHDAGAARDHRVSLEACELLQMLQYKCEVQRPLTRTSPVQCFPVDRLFRRCKDKKGVFTVETTAWEGARDNFDGGSAAPAAPVRSRAANDSEQNASRPHQWSSNWLDADSPSK